MSKSENSEELRQTSEKNRVNSPYTAITLDTCIYRKYKYRFDSGLLQTIPKLHVTYAITEIVVREINDHVADLHNKLIKELEKTRDHLKQWKLCSEDELQNLDKVIDENAVKHVFQEFFKTLKSIGEFDYVKAEHCEIEQLVKAYFGKRQPFGGEKKKYEFPDAIALFSLEKWAEENHHKILAISSDTDWLKYSEDSQNIDVISDLEAGLTQIQNVADNVTQWVENFIRKISGYQHQGLQDEIDQKISADIAYAATEVDEYSTYSDQGSVGGEITSISYISGSLRIANDHSSQNITLVNHTAKSTAFLVSATISVNAEAELDLVKHYDEGEDTISNSNEDVSHEEIEARLLFTFLGDVTSQNYIPEIDDVEFTKTLEIPFGSVEFELD